MILDSFKEEDIYILPKKELIGKYICIALYNGSFSIKNLAKILEDNPYLVLRDIIVFLLKNNLILLSNDIVYLTRKGFYNLEKLQDYSVQILKKNYLLRASLCSDNNEYVSGNFIPIFISV
jgi:hypothetical protein